MELIEREQQLKKLASAWQQAKMGRGRVVLVSGEAGIGKTSLVECFVSEQRKSARILRGACDALFSPQPLGPFIEIAIQVQSGLLELIQKGADRLSFSTELFMHLQQSAALTIVVLEDLHWADEATLDVVKFLGRRIQHTRILLILTYRDDEVSSKHPLWYLLGDFPTHLTDRIALPLLSRQAVERLAQQSNQLADELYRVTGGNPFFVTEIISCDADGVPASVRDAVLARVARLSAAAREVVELASLIPGAAEVWLIQAVLDSASTTLDECMERGILRSEENTLTFRHELARQAIEDSLPAGRLRDLHTDILETLLQQEADRIPLSRLVHHAVRAGNQEATLRYAPEAARRASALSAHREAISLYSSCLVYRHRLPLETQAELLEGLSFENYLVNNLDEAIRTRQQATGIWERLERYVRAGDCNRWLSRLYWVLGIQSEAKQYADRAVDILMNHPPGLELAMAFSTKSQIHMLAWEEDAALEWGNKAIELASRQRSRPSPSSSSLAPDRLREDCGRPC